MTTNTSLKPEFLISAFNEAADAIFIYDLNNNFIMVNSAACHRLGYSKKELLEIEPLKLYSPDNAKKTKAIIKKIISDKKYIFETVHVHKNGKEIPTEIAAALINYNKKTVIISIARDISKRKKLEKESNFLASIVKNSQDVIISKKLDGTIISWNLAAEKLYGYTEKEIIGKNIEVIVPLNKRTEIKKILEKIRRGEKVNHFQTQRIDKDKKIIDISLTVSPIIDNNNKVIAASTIAKDITQELEIRANYQALFDNIKMGIAVYRPNINGTKFFFKEINQAVEKIDNKKKEKIIGKEVREVFPGIIKMGLIETFNQVYKTGQAFEVKSSLYIDEKGNNKYRNNLVYRLPNKDIVAVYEDVTEQYKKLLETEKINKLMVDRELKMIELKEKINKLKNEIQN